MQIKVFDLFLKVYSLLALTEGTHFAPMKQLKMEVKFFTSLESGGDGGSGSGGDGGSESEGDGRQLIQDYMFFHTYSYPTEQH